jgi:hypothetical protein
MSTDTVAGETWRKGAGRYPSGDGDYVELVVPIRDGPNPVGGKLSVQMPEWLADAILRLKDEAREVQQGYERQLTKAGVWAAKAGLIQGKLDKAEREAQRLRTALERAEPTLRLAHAAMHMVRGYSEQGRVIDPASMGVTIDALLDASEVARTALEASEVKP